MKKSLFVIFFVALVLEINAQGHFSEASQDIVNPDLLNRKEYAGFKGSPYFSEEFLSGSAILKSGEERKFDSLKLDLYKNFVLFSKKGSQKAIDNIYLDEIRLDTKSGGIFKILEENGSYNFYQVLFRDKFTLLKYQEISLKVVSKEGATSYSGNVNSDQKVFESKELYFMTEDFKNLEEIPRSNKDFLSAFSKFKNLDSFLKKEKLKVKKELDLIEIFNELNRNY